MLEQVVVLVEARGDGEGDAGEPGAVAFAEETRGEGRFADGCRVELGGLLAFLICRVLCCQGAWTHHASIVTKHVECVSQLSSYGCEPQYWIHALGIAGYSRGAEVLDELAHAHQLARRAECLLGRFIRGYGRRGSVRAVQVPGEEAGEVLEGTEHLVASD